MGTASDTYMYVEAFSGEGGKGVGGKRFLTFLSRSLKIPIDNPMGSFNGSLQMLTYVRVCRRDLLIIQ